MKRSWILFWSANAVALGAVVLGLAVSRSTSKLHARTQEEVRALSTRAVGPAAGSVVRREELDPLPPPVQRWLTRAGVVGRPRAVTVHLRQRGEMHTGRDGAWFPIEAEQWFRADEPAFVWWVQGRMGKVIPIAGRDELSAGHGEMHVTAGGLVDLAFARGPEIDQGALVRWLAETIWFPSAALEPFVWWTPIDDTYARATISGGDITASVMFRFDREGRVEGLEAMRYFGPGRGLERWGGRNTEWRRIDGIEIPTRGEVSWFLEPGAFDFFRWEILDVETRAAGAS